MTFFTKRSPEVPAIAWILETTTDPRVIDAAAEIAVDLQWPLNMDLAPSMGWSLARLCMGEPIAPFDTSRVQQVLRRARNPTGTVIGLFQMKMNRTILLGFGQLWNVIRVYNESPDCPNALEVTSVGRWALRVIPSINPFGAESKAQRDKSNLKSVLITELFKNLQAPFLEAPTVTRVIETTAELAHHTLHEDGFSAFVLEMLSEISTLCCLLYMCKESPHVFVTAATLGRVEDLQELEAILQVMPFPVEWVFAALEHEQWLPDERQESSEDSGRWDNSTTCAVRSLLQFLILSETGNFPNHPSEDAMNMIVSALLIPPPADILFVAFLVLCKTRTGSLGSITPHRSSVWKHLGRVAMAYPSSASRYITLGAHLANISE
ncbi:hypothetical protein B0H16DRAFT_1456866 [Mycena metata]|uniref:Uncharacterized protein n=1 Tax=Mycena metata TaxID=1033252 RepID=A0AAD7JBH8_9AGAR|nr:hypothetical protein B0H16DRAFT_1456866 [Mycena metata]